MTNIPGLFGTWSKVSAIKEQLHHYEYVVFMDADTIFPHPHVPLEWLFNYWDIVPGNLVAMAIDPSNPINEDSRGRTMLNTGFVIAQKSARTHELFEAWESCPNEKRYPGCFHFSHDWSHEQGAFGNFLRYDFNRPEDVKLLSCMEANGCPEVAHLNCAGKLVRHYWGSKASVPSAVHESIMQYLLSSLHGQFHQHYNQIVSTTMAKGIVPGNQTLPVTVEDSSPPNTSQVLKSEPPSPNPEDLGSEPHYLIQRTRRVKSYLL